MSTSITFRGKEVKNPLARISLFVVGAFLIGQVIGLAVLLSPVWFPLNLVLKFFGRNGFIRTPGDGKLEIIFDERAFQKKLK